MASVILFYDSDTISYPDVFKPFTVIPAVSNTLAFKTVREFADETAAMVIPHIKYAPFHPPVFQLTVLIQRQRQRRLRRRNRNRHQPRRTPARHQHHQQHLLRRTPQALRQGPRRKPHHHPAGLAAHRLSVDGSLCQARRQRSRPGP